MVRISSFTRGNIDQRVQSGVIDKSGAGRVASAVSKIGANSSAMANEFLLQQKREQAFDYSVRSSNEKAQQRKLVEQDFKNQLDPVTGQISDGRTYSQAIEDWEKEYDNEVFGNAPTNLARTTYKSREAGNTRSSILGAGQFEFNERRNNSRINLNKAQESRAKSLQASDSKTLKITGTNLTNETINEMREGFADTLEFHNSSLSMGPTERSADMRTTGNNIAVAGLNSMLRNEEYVEVLDNMGINQLLQRDKKSQETLTAFFRDATGKQVGDMRYQDGLVQGRTSDGDIITYNVKTGGFVDLPELKIEAVQEGVDKPELDENLILEYVTPPQQQSYIMKALRGSKVRARKNDRGLLNRSDNLIAAMKAPQGEEGKETYDQTVGHSFSDTVRKNIADINSSPTMDPITKQNAISKIAAAAEFSRFTEDTPFRSVFEDELAINASDEAIDEMLDNTGVAISDDDKRKIKLQTKRELRSLVANKASMLQKNPERYILSNDEDIKTQFELAKNSEAQNRAIRANGGMPDISKVSAEYSDLKDSMDERYDQLEVATDNRRYFDKSDIESDMGTIRSLGAPGTGDRKQLAVFLQESIESKGPLAQKYFEELRSKGLNTSMLLSLKAPRNEESLRFIEDLIDVTIGGEEIADTFKAQQDSLPSEQQTRMSDLRADAQKLLDPLAEYFNLSGNFNNKREEVASYREAVAHRAAVLMGAGQSREDSVQNAYDYFIGGSYREGISETGSMFVPERVIQNLQLSTEKVDAITQHYSSLDALPVDKIDLLGMVSPSYVKDKVIPALQASRPKGAEIKRSDVERFLAEDLKSGKLGTISTQDEGDRMYFTLTPNTGVSIRSEVIKLKRPEGAVNSKEYSVKYSEAAENPTVLELEQKIMDSKKTVFESLGEFFNGQ